VATQVLPREADRNRAPAPPHRSSPPVRGHRRDIQGLRALAVVSVALSHAELPGLGGGYVGVDVFFVISGYLITQLLLREAQQTGRISLGRFYSRRARRILPAATLVLIATAIGSALLLGFVRASEVIRDSVWSAMFAANVKFSHDETSYFSTDNPPSPLQHFWSLAVEEQFYLVWPLLLLCLLTGLGVLCRRLSTYGTPRSPAPERVVAVVAGLVVGASLIWSIALTDSEPQAAYFSTPARGYELGIGAACAALGAWTACWSRGVRSAVGWFGLVAVGVAIFRFGPHTPFPGYAALLPVLGTALVIAAGEAGGQEGPQRLLSTPAGQHIGAWSYSLYLWHWPVLVIAAGYIGHALSWRQNLALLGGALVLSALTYHLVENPFRRAKLLGRKTWVGLAIYPLALGLTLSGCAAAQEVIDHDVAAASKAPPITVGDYGRGSDTGPQLSSDPTIALVQASVEAARNNAAIPGHLNPPLLELSDSFADTGECDYSDEMHQLCRLGDPAGQSTMVVLGDSHARAWIPALDKVAGRSGLAAYYLVKPGCNAGLITPDIGFGPSTGCVDWRDWALEQAASLHPDLVVIASDLPPGYVNDDGVTITDQPAVADAVSVGMIATIDRLRDSTGRFAIIGDAPGLAEEPGVCLSTRGADLGDCASPQTEKSMLLLSAERRAAHVAGVDYIDTMPWFCADALCPSVIGATVAYRDAEHVTTEYAALLARPLQAALGL